MFELRAMAGETKPVLYAGLLEQATALIQDERDWLANLANTASLIYHLLPGLNWAGFYLWRHEQLVLGPFQGKPACVRIALGRGVCGTAAQRRATVVVPDVHLFPGHIACDAASRSEVVVPLGRAERLLGVLDLDSPELERFDRVDAHHLELLVRMLVDGSDWPAHW
ncbi:MAG TPA: diguanylate cyclase [Clostridiales bacterium UBA8153]|nr:diguanylate cyclase [Clostridiales bacterium UBA8153]